MIKTTKILRIFSFLYIDEVLRRISDREEAGEGGGGIQTGY